MAPEKIENFYLRSKYIAQAFVYGESLRSVLVAVIVPDPDVRLLKVVSEFVLQLNRPLTLSVVIFGFYQRRISQTGRSY